MYQEMFSKMNQIMDEVEHVENADPKGYGEYPAGGSNLKVCVFLYYFGSGFYIRYACYTVHVIFKYQAGSPG